ncbi:RNase adapter RapZ [Allohahella sp. A8]|uniref:RNase adapter RapZ n=1 Tax=Allohahella sp. A8 TaxID=3141461 RepID=UPI000C09EC8D|nr:RNase adapter RapZ [Hahellaceae bacterium]
MKLIIVSGRSGSGKSTALHVLEDLSFYCIDNLPVGLLKPLVEEALSEDNKPAQNIAVSIDARNLNKDFASFPEMFAELKSKQVECEIIFLDADDQTLLQRFNATRRKHPLSTRTMSLKEAISHETKLLEPISTMSSLYINTSNLSIYQLRDQVKLRVSGHSTQELALLFQSFGYKHGVPSDSDYVFDVRCLPNPYWDPALRRFRGTEDPVIEFLDNAPEVQQMKEDISRFLKRWLPEFKKSNRTYLTISIGCTGGQHRSVYLCEQLGREFRDFYDNVQIRHKELAG